MDIYTNGLDSIAHAIEHYTDPSDLVSEEHKYKYAVLHLSHGALLLLKDRLYQEHPEFIKKDIGSKDNVTVNLSKTIERLQTIAKVNFVDLDVQALKTLTEQRNSIEHNAFALKTQHVDNIIARVFRFLLDFYQVAPKLRKHPNRHLYHEIDTQSYALWQKLIDFERYRNQAIKVAGTWISKRKVQSYQCMHCSSKTAVVEPVIVPVLVGHSSLKVGEGKIIRCLVCCKQDGFLTSCSQCGKEIMQESDRPCIAYCGGCVNDLKLHFSDLQDPRLLSELMKIYKRASFLRINQMKWLQELLHIEPSHYHLAELLANGYVSFTNKGAQSRFVKAVTIGKSPSASSLLGVKIVWNSKVTH